MSVCQQWTFNDSFSVNMVRRRISEAQRWKIIGMHTIGMSFKAIGRQMGYHYTVVSRLVRKHTQTNNVKDLPRSGRPRVLSDRDNRALHCLVRRMPFATSPVLCSLGYRLYFCVSKPLSGLWLHETETGSRLTNGSCAMSLNSNHIVLSTMPSAFVDVGLPTVDV
jgi:hypothetical protein